MIRNPFPRTLWALWLAQGLCAAVAIVCGGAYLLAQSDNAGLACAVASFCWCASVDATRGDA